MEGGGEITSSGSGGEIRRSGGGREIRRSGSGREIRRSSQTLKNTALERTLCAVDGVVVFFSASYLLLKSTFFKKKWAVILRLFILSLILFSRANGCITCFFFCTMLEKYD